MKVVLQLLVTFVFLGVNYSAYALSCPEYPQQTSKGIESDVGLSIKALKRFLGQAEFGVKTKIIVNNLYEDYPNADRIVIMQMLLSQFCSILNDSDDLPSSEKLDYYKSTEKQILDRLFPMPVENEAEKEVITATLDFLDDRGVLQNPMHWEDRAAVYLSLSEIRQELGVYLQQLPVNSEARKPLKRMQKIARKTYQNMDLFPEAAATRSGPIGDDVKKAIRQLRTVFERETDKLRLLV